MSRLTKGELQIRVAHTKGTAFLLLEDVLEHNKSVSVEKIFAAAAVLAIDTNTLLDELVDLRDIDP